MGNKATLFTTIGMIAAIILAIIFLARGCSTSGRLNEQINDLTGMKTLLEREKDSLMRELQLRGNDINVLQAEREELNGRIAGLNDRIKALSSTSASRATRLKESEDANRMLQDSYTAETAKSADLQNELDNLRDRLAAVERDLAAAQSERDRLAGQMRTSEEKRIADSIAEANKPVSVPERTYGWYVNSLELGGAYGMAVTSVDYADWFFGLTNVFGYAFSERMSGGIGTGVQFYNGGAMIPLYLDFRYSFGQTRWRPFLIADGGLTFPVKEFSSTGAFISPSIGIQRLLNDKSAINLSFGVWTQMTPTTSRSTFLLLRAGYTFNNR